MAAHERRISSLSVTYQEEYHRPHSTRKHTAVKHHPFAKIASGSMGSASDRITKPKQSFQQLAKVPTTCTTDPQSNPLRTAAFNSSSCLEAVPVPQLPEDDILEEVCEDFGGELSDILQDKADSTAALYPPMSSFNSPIPHSPGTTSVPPLRLAEQCSTTDPSLSTTHQTLHTHQMYDGTEQYNITPSPAPNYSTCTHRSIDVATMRANNNIPQTAAISSAATSSVAPCSVPWAPSPPVYHLYGLEDQLRHKINVEIENFRMLVQQTLYEQFHHYEVTYPQHSVTYEQNKPISQFRRDLDVDSQERFEKTELVQQMNQEDSTKPNEIQHDIDSHQELLEGSSTCSSVYSNGEMSITGDSGVELCTQETPSTIEQQIDSCLIQLQTCSLAMTSILSKRTEYSVL